MNNAYTNRHHVILFILIAFINTMQAQHKLPMENSYDNLLTQLNAKQKSLDSLSSIYSGRIETLEALKRSSKTDDPRVLQFTASALSLSDEISNLRAEVKKIQEKLVPVREKLKEEYSEIIASLQSKRQQSKSTAQTGQIDEQLLYFLTRKLSLASPELKFSFDPAKLAASDLSKINNPEQKQLYVERFRSAFNEVERLLASISETAGELQRIVKLQKKSKHFMEEKEFTSSMNYQKGGTSALNDKYANSSTGTSSEITPRISSSMDVYQGMLTQLSFLPEVNTFMRDNRNSRAKEKNTGVQNYLNTLRELQSGLQEFKQLIGEKLDRIQ
ncbi:MAG: hypothetical protein HY965_04075 [Ignavibacteriales bacterium]|nr:hypothetical protein [Ignavibacteriales bacterium]